MKKTNKAVKDFFNPKNIKKNTNTIIKKIKNDFDKSIEKCQEINKDIEKQFKKAFSPKKKQKKNKTKKSLNKTEICISILEDESISWIEKTDSDSEDIFLNENEQNQIDNNEEDEENENEENEDEENEDEDKVEEEENSEFLNEIQNESTIILTTNNNNFSEELADFVSINNNSKPIEFIERSQLVKSNSESKIIYIKEISQLDSNYKTFVVNQANNVYSCPLLPVIIETDFVSKSNNSSLTDSPVQEQIDSESNLGIKDIISKGYWDRKIGRVYRVKFICQVCGNVPKNFKGYRVHVVNNWAKNLLNILSKSLFVLQIALAISGIPNGFSEIGKLALESINSIQGDIIKQKLDGVSTNSLGSLKSTIADSIGEAEQNKYILSQTDNLNSSVDLEKIDSTFEQDKPPIKYVPINADYVLGMKELFMAFGEPIPPRKSGLIFVTRSTDFECAWVCQGSNGCSSSCYKKFTESKELNSLIRFCFQ